MGITKVSAVPRSIAALVCGIASCGPPSAQAVTPCPTCTASPPCIGTAPIVYERCSCDPFEKRLLTAFQASDIRDLAKEKIVNCVQSLVKTGGKPQDFELSQCVENQTKLGGKQLDAIVAMTVAAVNSVSAEEWTHWNRCYELVTGTAAPPVQAPPPSTCATEDLADIVGCSDGTREALIDLQRFPKIAGCGARWDMHSLRDAKTDASCGGDAKCPSPADACAPSWHICGIRGPSELRDRVTEDECESMSPGEFVAALGDQECFSCDAGGGYGAVCCGRNCIQQQGSCVWPKKTAWFGEVDNHVQACGSIEMRWDPARYGVLCCRD